MSHEIKVVKQENEVSVLENGDAFISQRKAAELCGVEQQAIQQRCLSQQYDVKQGISAENAFLRITHFAIESKAANDTARKSLAAIGAAGTFNL